MGKVFQSIYLQVLLTNFYEQLLNKDPLTRLSYPIQSFSTFPILHQVLGKLSSLLSTILAFSIVLTGSLQQFLGRYLSFVRYSMKNLHGYSELQLYQNH